MEKFSLANTAKFFFFESQFAYAGLVSKMLAENHKREHTLCKSPNKIIISTNIRKKVIQHFLKISTKLCKIFLENYEELKKKNSKT